MRYSKDVPHPRTATLADARGYLTTYEYDAFDRRVKLRYPDPTTPNSSSTTDFDQIGYDAYGLINSQKVRGSSTDAFTPSYDNLGRLTSRDAPGSQPDVSYTYDLLGRLTSQSQSGNTITTVYDALSRVTSQTTGAFDAVSYLYDAAGRRSRMTYPGSGLFVTYEYSDAGDLSKILANGSASTPIATYTYDDLGRRHTLTRGNGVVTTYSFDARSRLTSLQLTGSSQNTTFGFDYNPSGQIVSRTQTDSVYNAVLPVGTDQSYTPNGLNQYTSALGVTPTYDMRGNLTGDGTKTYGYDYDNRLTSASGSVSLAYDPSGRLYRVASSSTATRFLYDGSDVIAEYDDNTTPGVLRRYVHGPGNDEPLVWYEGADTSTPHWLMADERGSVIGITNSSGTVTQVNNYDAYGEPDAGNQGRFQYTGQMWIAELSLYHYKARAYDPRLGRFMQTDPIGLREG